MPSRSIPTIIALTLLFVSAWANEKVTIVYLNDTHGQIEPIRLRDGSTYGGFARIAYLVDSLGNEADVSGSAFYFLHGGDLMQGPPLSNVSGARLDVELFNEMGLDAMCIGNHEFDFGMAGLDSAIGVAEFPILSLNVVDASGKRPYQPFIMTEAGRQRILIVGMTTEYAGTSTYPDNVRGLQFLPADSTLTVLLDSLRYGDKDLVIVLEHRGWEPDSALALAEPRIDVIVGGHTHAIIPTPRKVQNALIVQAGAKGIYLGKLELEIEKGKVVEYEGELIEVSDSVPSEPGMAKEIAGASVELEKVIGGRIGSTEVALVRGIGVDSAGIRSLGDFLAELMREEVGADVAFTNQGGVRAEIGPGDVSVKDVLTALPFQNTIVTMDLTGDELQTVLDYNVSLLGQAGGSLHLAGVTYEVKDNSAVEVRVGGTPLEKSKTYRIATNNFLAAGGDGYEMLKRGKNIYDTGTNMDSPLIRYFQRADTLRTEQDN